MVLARAKPNDLKRLGIVAMVSVDVGIAAHLAR
jgi:hypothetical protein